MRPGKSLLDEVELLVPVRQTFSGSQYVRLIDIPQPWRGQFAADHVGSASPIPEDEGDRPCYFAQDWAIWLQRRFEPTYKPIFACTEDITDELATSWEKLNPVLRRVAGMEPQQSS